jgi:hypothetical protein
VGGSSGRLTWHPAEPLGPGRAIDITLTDDVPPDTTFWRASWSSTAATCTTPAVGDIGTVTCRPNNATSSLAANSSFRVTMTVRVTAGAGPAVFDQATVSIPSSLDYDPDTSNNSAVFSVAVL